MYAGHQIIGIRSFENTRLSICIFRLHMQKIGALLEHIDPRHVYGAGLHTDEYGATHA